MCPVELVLPATALSEETETLLREWIDTDGARRVLHPLPPANR